jgi:Zn-finger nucleic acid-binding protein
MEAHFYVGGGNVVMDTCEPCCLHWLDHDELARIAQANPDQPNAIDNSPDSFYDPTLDRENQNFAAQADPAAEAVDLLSRLLKPRI